MDISFNNIFNVYAMHQGLVIWWMMSVHVTLESCEVLGYDPYRIATRKYATAVVSSLLALQVGRNASDVECMTYEMGKKTLQINQAGGECKTASLLMIPSSIHW
jgi:hypothetical protein